MLFNSVYFAIFFPLFFTLWWTLRKLNHSRLTLLLIASCFFYGWTDIANLILLVLSSTIDYLISRKLFQEKSLLRRRALLCLSFTINFSVLFTYKYLNFAFDVLRSIQIDSIQTILSQTSIPEILLPVGISFYTFQKFAYVVDVYRRQIDPAHNWLEFITFILFFPQLVAGPVERAGDLLPQIRTPGHFNYPCAVAGMRLILTGLLKKIVISDQCAPFVDQIFSAPTTYSANYLFYAAVLFSVQIFCDFSGYSDIAIGCASLLGFRLTQNFRSPYRAVTPGEFWRRWHITLSTWFRDYVYVPLGGNRHGHLATARNVLIVFALSGIWHGAGWNYVFWGLAHGLLVIFWPKTRPFDPALRPRTLSENLKVYAQRAAVLLFVTTLWIIFRSASLTHGMEFISHAVSNGILNHPGQVLLMPRQILNHEATPALLCFIAFEFLSGDNGNWGSVFDRIRRRPVRWLAYSACTYSIIWNMAAPRTFIYFAF
jgi:D-alanyl-lipoteichoic acid acyltransferase DltB (MBOAT superfamily)